MARNPRAAAQRRTAKAVREHRTQIPENIKTGVKAARIDYYNGVISGKYPAPAPGSMEAKNLGSIASKARWGKADPRYEKAFSKYWYHNKEQNFGPDADRYEEGDESDRDDEGEE